MTGPVQPNPPEEPVSGKVFPLQIPGDGFHTRIENSSIWATNIDDVPYLVMFSGDPPAPMFVAPTDETTARFFFSRGLWLDGDLLVSGSIVVEGNAMIDGDVHAMGTLTVGDRSSDDKAGGFAVYDADGLFGAVPEIDIDDDTNYEVPTLQEVTEAGSSTDQTVTFDGDIVLEGSGENKVTWGETDKVQMWVDSSRVLQGRGGLFWQTLDSLSSLSIGDGEVTFQGEGSSIVTGSDLTLTTSEDKTFSIRTGAGSPPPVRFSIDSLGNLSGSGEIDWRPGPGLPTSQLLIKESLVELRSLLGANLKLGGSEALLEALDGIMIRTFGNLSDIRIQAGRDLLLEGFQSIEARVGFLTQMSVWRVLPNGDMFFFQGLEVDGESTFKDDVTVEGSLDAEGGIGIGPSSSNIRIHSGIDDEEIVLDNENIGGNVFKVARTGRFEFIEGAASAELYNSTPGPNPTLATNRDIRARNTIPVTSRGTQQVVSSGTVVGVEHRTNSIEVPSFIGIDYTLTSTPTVAAGLNGQHLTLRLRGDNNVTIQDDSNLSGSNVFMNAGNNVTLTPGSTISFVYDDGGWYEVGRSIR